MGPACRSPEGSQIRWKNPVKHRVPSKESVEPGRPTFYLPGVRIRWSLFLALAAIAAACPHPLEASPPPPVLHPQRIVSINLVSDIILLDLVDPGRIVALSWLAADPDTSPVADRASGFPKTRGQVEAILPLKPDLVIGTLWGQDRTLKLLEQIRIPVHRIELAQNYREIESTIRSLALAVGETERGESLISRMHERLAALRSSQEPPRGGAVWLSQAGFNNGENELSREILLDAGWLPMGTGSYSLESLVIRPPGAVIEARYQVDHPTLASRLRQHPAVRNLPAQTLVIRLADFLSASHLTPSVSEELRKQSLP